MLHPHEHELYRLNQKRLELQDQPGIVVVIHKYRPGWAIVLGIIGLLFFLLGALFFLVKNTDVLSVSA